MASMNGLIQITVHITLFSIQWQSQRDLTD